ncbi:MAG: peptidase S8, partial [Lysobacter sp.]
MEITNSRYTRRRVVKLSVLALGLIASGMVSADAHLGEALNRALATAGATERLEVVVSYNQVGPMRSTQVQALKALGITKGISMRTLPIAGALATPAQIRALAERGDVLS